MQHGARPVMLGIAVGLLLGDGADGANAAQLAAQSRAILTVAARDAGSRLGVLRQFSRRLAVISSPNAACTDGAGDQSMAACASGAADACAEPTVAFLFAACAAAAAASAFGFAAAGATAGADPVARRFSAAFDIDGCARVDADGTAESGAGAALKLGLFLLYVASVCNLLATQASSPGPQGTPAASWDVRAIGGAMPPSPKLRRRAATHYILWRCAWRCRACFYAICLHPAHVRQLLRWLGIRRKSPRYRRHCLRLRRCCGRRCFILA